MSKGEIYLDCLIKAYDLFAVKSRSYCVKDLLRIQALVNEGSSVGLTTQKGQSDIQVERSFAEMTETSRGMVTSRLHRLLTQ
ncbi:hypothetical protein RRG08_060787 [Elysia crispata]|uniref:Uncharacterized protein n=1 Tax=Elysia crispata TaxID=231223 RepID=A0AAE1B1Q0_9GAST|nr:hypothetical protein RRG08_060787 [Elysia crispata]